MRRAQDAGMTEVGEHTNWVGGMGKRTMLPPYWKGVVHYTRKYIIKGNVANVQ